jgi:hypothetical protein
LTAGTPSKAATNLSAELSAAVKKMPPGAKTQYRGIRLTEDELAPWDKQFALGNVVESDSFWSTAPSDANAYGSRSQRSLVIHTDSAKDISDLAFGVHMHGKIGAPVYDSEALIPPGVKFKVVAVDDGQVTLEEIK